jgi:crotonobetainyl-CoA:carnitine CoA-transferase CaiB-like acyl-CoA transferase
MLLAEADAEVMKIEPSGTGEPGRNVAPFEENARGERTGRFVLRFNRHREDLILSLKTPVAPGSAKISSGIA